MKSFEKTEEDIRQLLKAYKTVTETINEEFNKDYSLLVNLTQYLEKVQKEEQTIPVETSTPLEEKIYKAKEGIEKAVNVIRKKYEDFKKQGEILEQFNNNPLLNKTNIENILDGIQNINSPKIENNQTILENTNLIKTFKQYIKENVIRTGYTQIGYKALYKDKKITNENKDEISQKLEKEGIITVTQHGFKLTTNTINQIKEEIEEDIKRSGNPTIQEMKDYINENRNELVNKRLKPLLKKEFQIKDEKLFQHEIIILKEYLKQNPV